VSHSGSWEIALAVSLGAVQKDEKTRNQALRVNTLLQMQIIINTIVIND
jgi:hypothetical protein